MTKNADEIITLGKRLTDIMSKYVDEIETKANADPLVYPIEPANIDAYKADKNDAADSYKKVYVADALATLTEKLGSAAADKKTAAEMAEIVSRVLPSQDVYKEYVGAACAKNSGKDGKAAFGAAKTGVSKLAEMFKKNPKPYDAKPEENDALFKLAAETVVNARVAYQYL